MTFSTRRIFAILQKDYKDLSRNLYVTTTLFMPLLMAALFGRMGMGTISSYYIVINMGFILVATYVQSALIAEEKEKNTLRGLMLSPASTMEIFCGKSLLSFIATAVVVTGSILLSNYNPRNMAVIAIALLLSAVFYVGLGTLIGLFTKSVMEASVVIVPVMLIFTSGSLLIPLIEKYPVLAVVEYMPNLQLLELANRVETGAGLGDTLLHLLIILAWVLVIHAVAAYVYKKRMVDE
ncbi:ABC transporter permease [Paenibacillus sp. DMB5]|uniref:ABC transporter permease n=1 Tax=Paenibacillus sp. DMB5 TaxID=1780103 RepID=UPI00076DE1FB|nr:ABC transporter permease [Paenibacillus sp. DMB5]KUP24626.1 ABC transporter [Paenibacillus sp. DMB5]